MEGNTGNKSSDKKPGTDAVIEMTEQSDDVIAAEREHLGLKGNGWGFAISGGGIRSASFGLGVMQALVSRNKLKRIDYMSTVSGGGYVGAALTWALHKSQGTAGTDKTNFPLGKKGQYARRSAGSHNNSKNSFLDFMRQHSSYLMPTRKLGIFAFGSIVLRSIFLSMLFYFSFTVLLMTLFLHFDLFKRKFPLPSSLDNIHCIFSTGVFIPSAIILVAIFVLLSLVYSLRTFITMEAGPGSRYAGFIDGQIIAGFLWKFCFVFLLFGLLPLLLEFVIPRALNAIAAGGISSVSGALVGLWQYKKAQINNRSTGPFSDVILYLGAFALIYGIMIMAYIVSQKLLFVDEKIINGGCVVGLSVFTLVLGICVNLNLVGPHRLWRDRLMEAFMPDDDAVNHNKWKPARKADGAKMEKMCDKFNPRPFHIINTNVILSHSTQVKFNGRGGDNFAITPLYCGSDATGWRTTSTFNKAGKGITLATAMATSAAALNPNAAVSGEGATRNTVVSVLLSMLNLRLGCWTINPRNKRILLPANFFFPGLKTEILRMGFKETNRRILLSDGGHFENLGIYELIRRKLEVIILSDGGADPEFNFDDLANAVEKVRVDFGAKIIFRAKYGLGNILPGTKIASVFDKKYSLGERGFAIADIYYADGKTGFLVYIKLSMIEGLPADIYSYKGLNPSFPHQPTTDQFFDEKQFEAYRELGYQVSAGFIDSNDGEAILA